MIIIDEMPVNLKIYGLEDVNPRRLEYLMKHGEEIKRSLIILASTTSDPELRKDYNERLWIHVDEFKGAKLLTELYA